MAMAARFRRSWAGPLRHSAMGSRALLASASTNTSISISTSTSTRGVTSGSGSEVESPQPLREFFPTADSGSSDTPMKSATLIAGDGIGKEVTDAMKEVMSAAEVPLEWDEVTLNPATDHLTESLVRSFHRTRVAVKGPFFTAPLAKKTSSNIVLRTELDLYANVVHAHTVPGVETRHSGIDLVVIRENTEGEYSGLEHEVVPGVVESLKIISQSRSMRIARYAFEYALRNNRKKVTAVHKANIMKQSDGLFLECCGKVAAEYPGVQYESMIVDNTCMQLTSRPQQFDVMVMPNLYGNIVTNIAAGLVGGPGLVPGMNVGQLGAMFEQGARHAGTQIAGMNIANPTGTILGSVMMLRHLKLDKHAKMIEKAVREVYRDSSIRTRDVGGSASTTDFVKAVTERLDD